jgi:lysophospholipase L1-like esterase
MKKMSSVAVSVLIVVLSVSFILGLSEGFLRLKNSSMKNYDIEMWRYSRELKKPSIHQEMDFNHVKSKSATLQGVEIRLNEWGLRGGAVTPVKSGERRILFLGSSGTLGWGVKEDDTIEVQVEKALRARGEKVQVLNGGVCNYNAIRYVSRFFNDFIDLHPTDIVVHSFLRDAEWLPPTGGNYLLQNSELAVTCWIAYHRLFDRSGEQALLEHYKQVYSPGSEGLIKTQDALERLATYAKDNGINLYFSMMPDIHDLIDYKYEFAHKIMLKMAHELGYQTIDILPKFTGKKARELWVMPGDPHPNAMAHKIMADAIVPMLSEKHFSN